MRLASGSTRREALVVPHIERWFFGAMVGGIENLLSHANIDVLLYHVGGPQDRANFFTRLPARRKVDAVVVVAFPVDDAERERLALLDVSIIAASGQSVEYPYVCIDDYGQVVAGSNPVSPTRFQQVESGIGEIRDRPFYVDAGLDSNATSQVEQTETVGQAVDRRPRRGVRGVSVGITGHRD